ncbi:MAG TPA: fatty acid--CoA ligase family protein [Chthoniobacterales bacterium]|nr:fatty acid--CoA ligase family protein [Chthoniobacterales bacterium]
MKNGILERWGQIVQRKGALPAVLMPDGSSARTLAGIEAEAVEIATMLGALPPGSIVSLQAGNVAAWPAMALGIWKAGAGVLLLDHTLGEGTRDAAEECCGAMLRLQHDGAKIFGALLSNAPAKFPAPAPHLIKLTSGTSGAPRAILFTAEQLLADCDQICEAMGIGESDLNYGVVAFSHSYGFSNLITPLLCRGVALVAAQDALPRAISSGIAASGATVLPAVPAVFHALSGVEGALPGLRLCISAGAPLRVETADAFRARFGLKVHTFYGASECGGIAYDGTDDAISLPGFVGTSMPGVQIGVSSEGAVSVRSPAVGSGYFPIGGEELGGGEFRPADLLRKLPDGWQITGRRSDVINVGGKKASPSEIEAVLISHPGVREAVVFGVGNSTRTETVCACVVADEGTDMAGLKAWCAGRLPAWQVPRAITRVEAIPVNARGKISRLELAARFADLV